jgi:hypothetical protein
MKPELEQYFSSARLAPYLLPGEAADVASARYQWNLRLAEALLPSLSRLRTIKALRNRIAHHEPIWKMTPTVDEVHQTCLEIVSGMSAAAAVELAKIDRFSSVYTNGLKEK